ncbi:MAG: hypothetical protein AB1512_09635 [Thermodesulfobacteriota bacterium]
MRYDDFRDQLLDALKEVRLFAKTADNMIETIDITRNERSWKLCVSQVAPAAVEPFHVSTKIAFNWSPFEAARSYTCEEDLLAELLGDKRRFSKTAKRFIRVDLEFSAGLPYGSITPLPDTQVLGAWTDSVRESLDKLLSESKEREGRLIAVLGGWQEPKIEAQCFTGNVLSLEAVSIEGFRLVRMPRVWDHPDRRETEKGAEEELALLAQRLKHATDEWTRSIAELAKWIRYAPPPSDAKRPRPWFLGEEEEDDGPETIH